MIVNSTYISGVKVNLGLNMKDVMALVSEYLSDQSKSHHICTTNPEFVLEAQCNSEFKEIINNSDLSVPDGIGILYANYYLNHVKSISKNLFYPVQAFMYGLGFGASSLFKKYDLGERITGVNLTHEICKYAQSTGKSVYLLGGRYKNIFGVSYEKEQDLANNTKSNLLKLYPKLKIIGATSSYSYNETDDAKTFNDISESMRINDVDRLDILLVAYGHPHQEKWIQRNKVKLNVNLCIGVGGTFDYISGIKPQSPEFFVSKNIDWVYRLLTQPWRFVRIMNAFLRFSYLIFLNSLK